MNSRAAGFARGSAEALTYEKLRELRRWKTHPKPAYHGGTDEALADIARIACGEDVDDVGRFLDVKGIGGKRLRLLGPDELMAICRSGRKRALESSRQPVLPPAASELVEAVMAVTDEDLAIALAEIARRRAET